MARAIRINPNKVSCPRCGAKMNRAISLEGTESTFWLKCPRCNTYVDTYIPSPAQYVFHQDPAKYVGYFGGFGSAKTTSDIKDLEKHLFITPAGQSLIGAQVFPQLESTFKRDFEKDLPLAFLKHYNKQKNYFDINNGHRIIYRPLDDEGKFRSINLTRACIVEASEVKQSVYQQLKTRMRHEAALLYQRDEEGNLIFDKNNKPIVIADWRKIVMESNPDPGWIRTEVLLKSSKIHVHDSNQDYLIQEPDRFTSSHTVPTTSNPYLPPTFYEEQAQGKPKWWVERYLNASFDYAEGMVYPTFMNAIVEPYEIGRDWKRLVAHDYGLTDNATFLFFAINPDKGKAVLYREVVLNNRNVQELAEAYKNALDFPESLYYTAPIIYPKSGPKRDYQKKTLADHYLDHGIYFQPGAIDVTSRIYRTNTYIELGRLEIFNTCTETIKEGLAYKFPERSLDKVQKDYNKPVDKNNHCMNALEWVCMALPDNPNKLLEAVYNRHGESFHETDPRFYARHALSRPENYEAEYMFEALEDYIGEGGEVWTI